MRGRRDGCFNSAVAVRNTPQCCRHGTRKGHEQHLAESKLKLKLGKLCNNLLMVCNLYYPTLPLGLALCISPYRSANIPVERSTN